MTKKDKAIKKLVKAAIKAMSVLSFAQPLTDMGDAWDALHKAVKTAQKLR